MLVSKFEDLRVWNLSRELTREVYKLTSKSSCSRDFGFKDQIQRASVSIMLNIAEGFDSSSSKSFLIFLNYAYRSASEVRSILYIALDLNYIDDKEFEFCSEKIIHIQKMLNSLKTKIKSPH